MNKWLRESPLISSLHYRLVAGSEISLLFAKHKYSCIFKLLSPKPVNLAAGSIRILQFNYFNTSSWNGSNSQHEYILYVWFVQHGGERREVKIVLFQILKTSFKLGGVSFTKANGIKFSLKLLQANTSLLGEDITVTCPETALSVPSSSSEPSIRTKPTAPLTWCLPTSLVWLGGLFRQEIRHSLTCETCDVLSSGEGRLWGEMVRMCLNESTLMKTL